jgi:predicted  nucleic acid-binding Zn-ribbon protein
MSHHITCIESGKSFESLLLKECEICTHNYMNYVHSNQTVLKLRARVSPQRETLEKMGFSDELKGGKYSIYAQW